MRIGGVLVVSGAALLVAVLGFGLTVDPNEIDSPLVGREAPDLRLPVLRGPDSLALSELPEGVVVVNFWASWCLPCIQEHDLLVEAWNAYSDEGVHLVGVLYQDSPERGLEFLEEHGGGWLQVQDPDSRAAIEYGVYGVPETFVIDARGRISYKKVGPLEGTELVDAIERARQGPEGAGP